MKKLILLIALILGFHAIAEAGRMYDPEIARFTTPDPALRDYTPLEQMQLINGGLFSNNPYNYTLNNPVRYVDPDGRLPVLAPAIWGGIKLYAAIKASVVTATAGTAVYTGYRVYDKYGDSFSEKFNSTVELGTTIFGSSSGVVIDGTEITLPGSATEAPGESWEWRGTGEVSSKEGNWYNPQTGESLRNDLDHPKPVEPHWDYKDPDGKWWRVNPETGARTLKD